jgi:Bacteriophage Lambda NinG protein
MQPINQVIGFPRQSRSKTLKQLIGILDRVFSEYIRLRDADRYGRCRCVTCGKTAHWKEMDAGHFMQRDRKATRFDELNVHAQCPHCNRYRGGEQFAHGRWIDGRYGPGTADQLKMMSVQRTKLSADWLQFQIQEYRKKIKKIKESCCF